MGYTWASAVTLSWKWVETSLCTGLFGYGEGRDALLIKPVLRPCWGAEEARYKDSRQLPREAGGDKGLNRCLNWSLVSACV